jgi:hypothetical protein
MLAIEGLIAPIVSMRAKVADLMILPGIAAKEDTLAAEADETLVKPLLQFRNFGIPLPDNWTTVINSAECGIDYSTRTAIAKWNIFINRPRETRYFYQDLDKRGVRLTGASRYTISFKQLPPIKCFWSITLYSNHHFFVPTCSTTSRSAPRARDCASRLTARSLPTSRTSVPATTSSRVAR